MSLRIGNKLISSLGGATIRVPLYACTNSSISRDKINVKIKWSDSEDVIVERKNGLFKINSWVKTVLVVNEDHYPTEILDGKILKESFIKDEFKEKPFIWELPDNTKNYYFSLFPIDLYGICGDPLHLFTSKYTILGVRFNKKKTIQVPNAKAIIGIDPIGEYTDSSKDFKISIAKDINSVVRNDFDKVYPFNSIKEVDMNILADWSEEGGFSIHNVPSKIKAIKIPKFAMWANKDFTEIKIAEKPITQEWFWCPCFLDKNGKLRDNVYISKYHANLKEPFESGHIYEQLPPTVPPELIDQLRKSAQSPITTGVTSSIQDILATLKTTFFKEVPGSTLTISSIDFETYFCLLVLWLIVTRTRDIGSVPNWDEQSLTEKYIPFVGLDQVTRNKNLIKVKPIGATANSKSSLVVLDDGYQSFYGIENLFINVLTYIDGIFVNQNKLYSCKDSTKFSFALNDSELPLDYSEIGVLNYSENPQETYSGNGFIKSLKKYSNNTYFVDTLYSKNNSAQLINSTQHIDWSSLAGLNSENEERNPEIDMTKVYSKMIAGLGSLFSADINSIFANQILSDLELDSLYSSDTQSSIGFRYMWRKNIIDDAAEEVTK